MDDYLQRYLPEYDADAARARLSTFSAEDLVEMVIRAYKEKRLLLKMLEESDIKLSKIKEILSAPSELSNMPGIPGPNDLRRMTE